MAWPKKKKAELFPSADKAIHELDMPEGINFSALWEDPNQAGGLQTILSIANTVGLVILLIVVLVKH